MNKIIVSYYHGKKYSDLKFNLDEEFDYSTRKLNSIVHYLIKRGYSVQIRPYQYYILIWIDKGRFSQK